MKDIDTKAIRDWWLKFDNQYAGDILPMCEEIDTLRSQLKAYTGKCSGDCHEQDNEIAKLTAEVARLRQKCGERVCKKCGDAYEGHGVVRWYLDGTPDDYRGEAEGFCMGCIDNALAALRK